MIRKSLLVAGAALAVVSAPAFAAWTVDADGNGFVGKGDVQLALGYNNKQLQDNADSLIFAVSTTSSATWTCDRDGGSQTQERANTTTTSGIVSSTERVRNQITGFNLSGFSGGSTTETDGPAIGSCPTFWTAIDLVETPGEGTVLTVNGEPLL